MIKTKDLNFDEFEFNITGNLITTRRTYNKGNTQASMQLDLHDIYNQRVFQARLSLQHKLPNGKYNLEHQSAFIDLQGTHFLFEKIINKNICQ